MDTKEIYAKGLSHLNLMRWLGGIQTKSKLATKLNTPAQRHQRDLVAELLAIELPVKVNC